MTVMGEGKLPGAVQLRALGDKHGLRNAGAVNERVRDAVSRWQIDADEAGVTKKSADLVGRAIGAIATRGAEAVKPVKLRKKRS